MQANKNMVDFDDCERSLFVDAVAVLAHIGSLCKLEARLQGDGERLGLARCCARSINEQTNFTPIQSNGKRSGEQASKILEVKPVFLRS